MEILNFLSQTLSGTAHKDTLLDLLSVDSRGLLWDVVICGCLGHSNLEMAEYKIFTVMRKIFSEMRKKELLSWTAEEQGGFLMECTQNLLLRV